MLAQVQESYEKANFSGRVTQSPSQDFPLMGKLLINFNDIRNTGSETWEKQGVEHV